MLANIHRNPKKQPKAFTAVDFLPRWTRSKPQSPTQMLNVAKAITAAMGGRIENPGGEFVGEPRRSRHRVAS